jgi:serine/threonine-protein kinase SMG1
VKHYPKLVEDVRLVIDELGMITVLWEEQWLSTLQDLHSGIGDPSIPNIAILKY